MTEGPLLIVTAMPLEGRTLYRRMRSRRRVSATSALFNGQLFGTELLLLITGIGRDRVRETLEEAMALEPAAVLNAGFGGGLDPAISAGTVVCASRFLDASLRKPKDAAADRRLTERCLRVALQANLPAVESTSASCPIILITREDKAEVYERTGAGVAEMEGFWVAEAASAAGIPVAGVRVVLDSAARELPTVVRRVQQRRLLQTVVAHVMRHPGEIPGLVRLSRDHRRAAKALDRFLLSFVQEWGERPITDGSG